MEIWGKFGNSEKNWEKIGNLETNLKLRKQIGNSEKKNWKFEKKIGNLEKKIGNLEKKLEIWKIRNW